MEAIEALRILYKEQYNIDEVMVELMSDRDILHLTASGTSNKSISTFLNIDADEIARVNKIFYGFDGWIVDLDINPMTVYSNMTKLGYFDYETFRNELDLLSPYYEEDQIKLIFEVCSKFKTIEKLLEEEWN